VPAAGSVPARDRVAVRSGVVPGVPGVVVRGRVSRVVVHDHPAVYCAQHEPAGPDHRHVDVVLDGLVQVVLRGHIRQRVPRVSPAVKRHTSAGRRGTRPSRATNGRRTLETGADSEQHVRAQWLRPDRLLVSGRRCHLPKRVRRTKCF